MTDTEPKRAYELQLQKAKELNDITFLMKDVELRKWCVESCLKKYPPTDEGLMNLSIEIYQFITGYERAPQPGEVKDPEQFSDLPYDTRN